MDKKKNQNIFSQFYSYIILLISMAGYVPKHATILRTIAFASSLGFSIYLSLYQSGNSVFAVIYFIVAEIMYIGFIMLVLSRRGFRLWFKKNWSDEEEGYLAYEAILGFLFFHNALSMGFIASSTQKAVDLHADRQIFIIVILIAFAIGYLVKILAAKVVSIDIYYWKDMFLGKKITEFVVSGPYKYLSNPMYGIGQLPAYAAAIWYESYYGFMAAFLNQCLIFSFYYFFERKFINRVYLNKYI